MFAQMMQEPSEISPVSLTSWEVVPGQSLIALLALVGTKKMEGAALRAKAKLNAAAYRSLLGWLQREHLVDVMSTLAGGRIEEQVTLTESGEAVLVGLLERTCELPELR